jgi:hypothetical protein
MVQVIVADLEAAGYLTRARTGRRTRYTVNEDSLFRHSAQKGLRVGPFLALLTEIGDYHGRADPPKKLARRRTARHDRCKSPGWAQEAACKAATTTARITTAAQNTAMAIMNRRTSGSRW